MAAQLGGPKCENKYKAAVASTVVGAWLYKLQSK
jgi:hypothetical protein